MTPLDVANDTKVIQDHITRPIPGMTGCTDHRGWLMYATACLWQNVNVADANAKLAAVQLSHLDNQFCAGKTAPNPQNLWLAYLYRPYGLFGPGGRYAGRMTAAAQQNLLNQMWRYVGPFSKVAQASNVWTIHDSENHDAQEKSFKLLAAQAMKNANAGWAGARYADGSAPTQQYLAWRGYWSAWFDERAKRGLFIEVASPTYAGYLMQAIFNIYNFAEDPVLRLKAEMILDLAFADHGLHQLVNVSGSAKCRAYPTDSYDGAGDSMTPLVRLVNGQLPIVGNHAMVLATAGYRPPAVVRDIMEDRAGKGSYEYLSRRPGVGNMGKDSNGDDHVNPARSILFTSYVTPEYVIASYSLKPGEEHIGPSAQNRWQGVTFNTTTDARVYPQAAPTAATDRTVDGFFSVQKKNVLLTRKSSASTTLASGKATVIYFPACLDRLEEEDGWLFVAEGSAFLAVRPVDGNPWGYVWWTAAKNKAPNRDDRFVRLLSPYAPIIFEAFQGDRDPGTFAAFKAGIRNNPCGWVGNMLEYTGLDGDRLTLGTAPTSTPLINGAPLKWDPPYTFQSPFMRQDWATGKVWIGKGIAAATYDFSVPGNPTKTVS